MMTDLAIISQKAKEKMMESNRETVKLQTVTDELLKEADELEKRIMFTSQYINRII